MKILVGFPPTEARHGGTILLSQNRQLQEFHEPTFLYPVVMATAATFLRDEGYDVRWMDCIAEDVSIEKFIDFIDKEKIELFFFETKGPVIKRHWKVADKLKERFPNLKIVICGDHVSWEPGIKETMENSKIDFAINGGYYDFAIVDLVKALERKEKIPEGIWYRKNEKVVKNGRYHFKRKLDEAPFPDRDLVPLVHYSKEFNLAYKPHTYIMSGRDCWYGRCTFCFHPDTNVMTKEGIKLIKDIELNEKMITHTGKISKNNFVFKRHYNGDLVNIDVRNLPEDLKCTPNHKLFVIRKGKTEPRFIEASNLKKGDFVTFPLMNEVVDVKEIDMYNKLVDSFIEIPTKANTLEYNVVQNIFELREDNYSTRAISEKLQVNRGTVLEYLHGKPKGKITIEEDEDNLKFSYGTSAIPKKADLNKDFMRLVGYYLAEGCVTFRKNRPNSGTLQFTFNKDEKEYINDVVNLIEGIFNLEPYLVDNFASNTVQITVNSNILASVFKHLFGDGSLNKDIPEELMKLPTEKQVELIKGLFRGDGHLRERKGGYEYVLNTVSKQLAYKIWIILTRLYIVPSFYISRKETRTKAKHDQYVLSLNGDGINKLGFIDVKSKISGNRFTKIVDDKILFQINEIKREKYEGDVYNISVLGDQSYTANLMSVSNCVWDHTLYPLGTFGVRSPENVLEEVKYLVDKHGVREIFDDCGTITIGNWLKKFCNLMIESGYNKKVKYSCNMRFGAVNLEEYKLMKKAGFRLLKFGLESGEQKTIDKLDKSTKIEEIIPSCRDAKKAGLVVHLTMMVGYPWESKEDAEKTFQLAKRLMVKGYADVLQSTIVIPYPGTPLYDEGVEKGWFRFDPKDYDRFDMREPVFKTPDMTPEEVNEVCNRVYTIFWHPEYVIRRILNIRSFVDLKYTLNGAKAVIGHMKDFGNGVKKKIVNPAEA